VKYQPQKYHWIIYDKLKSKISATEIPLDMIMQKGKYQPEKYHGYDKVKRKISVTEIPLDMIK
jgi:hypothetical protein